MATSVDQKTKRAHAKAKATKAVNHVIKMMKDYFTTVNWATELKMPEQLWKI